MFNNNIFRCLWSISRPSRVCGKNWKLWIVNFDRGITACRIKVEDPQKITHPVIRYPAEQPGCLAFNHLFSASGRKFSITHISAFDCSVIENAISRPSG